MSITDTIFSCSETPVWTPATLDPSILPPCLSCTLRLSSKLPGTGSCTPNIFGLVVNENPTTEFVINGARYNLIATYLCFPGLHRLYGHQVVCDAELVVEFRHVSELGKYASLSVPLTKSATGSAYFHTLGQITSSRPVLSSLIPEESKILSYPGPSLDGRSALDPRPNNVCVPIARPTNWYVVLEPVEISFADFDRLYGLCSKSILKGPPKPIADISAGRAARLLTIIKGITLEGSESLYPTDQGGKSTSALKCYRIDPETDIENDKVYIGGRNKKKTTLQEELERAAELSGDIPDDGTIKPGEIERVVGIILGVMIGIALCAFIAFLIWRGTFSHYLSVLKLYEFPQKSQT